MLAPERSFSTWRSNYGAERKTRPLARRRFLLNTAGQTTQPLERSPFKQYHRPANTAIGSNALLNNTTGGSNTAIGANALLLNTTGGANTAIGSFALPPQLAILWIVWQHLGPYWLWQAGSNVSTANGIICIGHNGPDVTATTWIEDVYRHHDAKRHYGAGHRVRTTVNWAQSSPRSG